MTKKAPIILAAATTAAVVTLIATHAQGYYWHHILPNRLFKQMRRQLADEANVTGGWINMQPDAGWQDDRLIAAYRGGITTTTNTFRFTVSETGALIDLTRD
ncbi:hypothetical protein [Lacticaseibacillus daqingensis]|uniref:hypothetical protein n=1 Tax=Lacticaseibacillus daqingensis TaxID=2486014 RepID=UPI000F77DEE0|nr:hypothetical protein [Lacticaseibacillus daqingensis]